MSMAKKQKILFGWSLTTQTKQFRLCDLSVSAVNVVPPATLHILVEMFPFLEKFLETFFVLNCRRNPFDPFSKGFYIRGDGDS